jgi:mRNA interferase RelE/StbE
VSQYRIEIDRRVKKDLQSVATQDLARIQSAIADLATNPRPYGCKQLKGKTREYLRIRMGDYRIIYTVRDQALLIVVIRVGHRREIYKKL